MEFNLQDYKSWSIRKDWAAALNKKYFTREQLAAFTKDCERIGIDVVLAARRMDIYDMTPIEDRIDTRHGADYYYSAASNLFDLRSILNIV